MTAVDHDGDLDVAIFLDVKVEVEVAVVVHVERAEECVLARREDRVRVSEREPVRLLGRGVEVLGGPALDSPKPCGRREVADDALAAVADGHADRVPVTKEVRGRRAVSSRERVGRGERLLAVLDVDHSVGADGDTSGADEVEEVGGRGVRRDRKRPGGGFAADVDVDGGGHGRRIGG